MINICPLEHWRTSWACKKMSVNWIRTQELKLKRECLAWVSHLLDQEQMGLHLQLAEENQKKLQDPDYRHCERVISVNKLWIHRMIPNSNVKMRCGYKKRSESIRKFGIGHQWGRSNWCWFSAAGGWFINTSVLSGRELRANITKQSSSNS